MKEECGLVFVKKYIKKFLLANIPNIEKSKIHRMWKDFYESQLPLPPNNRTVLISRNTMRSQIDYHNSHIISKVTKEKEFADKWNKVYTLEQIKEAYEKMVDTKGSFNFSYINTILENKGEKPTGKSPVKKVKPSGFNNFEQKKTDFDEIRRKKRESLMNMMKGISNE